MALPKLNLAHVPEPREQDAPAKQEPVAPHPADLEARRERPLPRPAKASNESRLLPASDIAERGVLCSFLLAPAQVGELCRAREIGPKHFHNPPLGTIYATLAELWREGSTVDVILLTQTLSDHGLLEQVGGAALVSELFTYLLTATNITHYLDILVDKWTRREALGALEKTKELLYDGDEPVPEILGELEKQVVGLAENTGNTWESVLDALRFDPAATPPAERTIFKLGDSIIATPGNLLAVTAQAKAGKSAFIGAMLAATLEPEGDCLGVSSENPTRGAVILFDSEQSELHFHNCIMRALWRAKKPAPIWLRAYRLKSKSVAERQRFLRAELRRAKRKCGSIHSLTLDGIADFVNDPNDSAECFAFVQTLCELADKYETVIICVLHENPPVGKGNPAKTRGHLGSQLERKAESNLRLEKDGEGVTVVFSDKSRGAHIPKERGPRFEWSDEAKMHVSCSTGSSLSAAQIEARDFAAEVFKDCPSSIGLTWMQIADRIIELRGLTKGGAQAKITALCKLGAVRKGSDRKYRLA